LFFLIIRTNIIKSYIKDGSLEISKEGLILDSVTISIKEIKKIIITANNYASLRTGNGTGNRIEIFNTSGKNYNTHFVIDSKEQMDRLSNILDYWHNENVNISS